VSSSGELLADVGGGIELCYETFGDPADPAVLLVMGLGTQMLGWHDELCERLVERGPFRVVRFDNRDCGRSTHLDGPAPSVLGLLLRRLRASYLLADMAADAVGLLDHLGVRRAHVVGASMGGMIAQTLAARWPDRVRSLASVMSTTGSRWHGQPSPSAYRVLLGAAPAQRDAFVEHMVCVFATIGSPADAFAPDRAWLREQVGRAYDRSGGDPRASLRQLAAIVASGDRRRELRSIAAPTVVVHGTRDRLVAPSGGRATARAVPGARLVEIAGMGHDLPRGAWPRILDAIVANAARAPVDAVAHGWRGEAR
jgi:pimeloyl-ACP methyl ester carboxylesterase